MILTSPREVNFEKFEKRRYGLVFRVKLLDCADFCPHRACRIRMTSQNVIFCPPPCPSSASASCPLCDKGIHRASRWELKKGQNDIRESEFSMETFFFLCKTLLRTKQVDFFRCGGVHERPLSGLLVVALRRNGR